MSEAKQDQISPLQRLRWWWIDRHYWAARKVEQWAIAVSWRLPRMIAFWAFVRVATDGCENNPADQTVKEVMDRWQGEGS